jgi:hypothetical protein
MRDQNGSLYFLHDECIGGYECGDNICDGNGECAGSDVRVSVVFDDIDGFKMDIAYDAFDESFGVRGAEYGGSLG